MEGANLKDRRVRKRRKRKEGEGSEKLESQGQREDGVGLSLGNHC